MGLDPVKNTPPFTRTQDIHPSKHPEVELHRDPSLTDLPSPADLTRALAPHKNLPIDSKTKEEIENTIAQYLTGLEHPPANVLNEVQTFLARSLAALHKKKF